MSRRRKVKLQLWVTAEENGRLEEMAHRWGYKTIEDFVRGGLGKQGQFTEELHDVEKRQATTLMDVRTEIERLQRTEYVIFAMIENLAKTILRYMPMPAAENKGAAIALGKAAYDRYLRAVGTSLNNGSKSALQNLAAWDE
jgi:hypothetical protein